MTDSFLGTSCANIVERYFYDVVLCWNVDVRAGGIEPAEVVPSRYFAKLTIRKSLPPDQALEAVGVQFGLMVLGYLGPGQAPHWEHPEYERACRKQWLAALRWTANHLIRSDVMVFAEQEGWDDRRLAHETGVSLRLARVRIQEYARETGREVPFFAL